MKVITTSIYNVPLFKLGQVEITLDESIDKLVMTFFFRANSNKITLVQVRYNFNTTIILSFFEAIIIIRMVNVFKIILQHIKEYCEEAAIHGPQHIVSQRLAIFERLVLHRLLQMYTS